MSSVAYESSMILANGVIDKVISKNGGGVIFVWETESDTSEVVQVPYNVFSVTPERGEIWRVSGVEIDTDWGIQLLATDAARIIPSGDLFVKFVGGNARFKDISNGRAKNLWEKHGYEVYEHLKNGDSYTLQKPTSVPIDVIQGLCNSWLEYQLETDTIEWLHKHKVPTRIAFKVVSCYQDDTVSALKENPYRLVYFLKWKEVDVLGRKVFNIPYDDERRQVAAVESVMLDRWVRHGHTAIEETDLIKALSSNFKIGGQVDAKKAILLAQEKNALMRLENGRYQTLGIEALEYVMKEFMLDSNKNYSASLINAFDNDRLSEFQQAISLRSGKAFKLNKEQIEVVKLVMNNNFACITGGAGVGKTTVLKAIFDQIDDPLSIYQAALTNKAKIRMTEATGFDAITIARLLAKVENNDLSENCWLFIDEASMIDLPMFVRLVRALPKSTRLYLIGDSHQLAPIGPGLVFHLAVQTPTVPTVELVEIHRAALHTGIPQGSVKIRNQTMPVFDSRDDAIEKEHGFSLINIKSNIEEQIASTLSFYRRFIEKDDVQIIAATNRACDRINEALHKEHVEYLEEEDEFYRIITVKNREMSTGEPIVWLNENDHSRQLFNGTFGVLTDIYTQPVPYTDDDGKRYDCYAAAEFDGVGTIYLTASDLNNIRLAYAVTCHKAQGSQWTRVIVCVDYSPTIMDNSWIYTSVTRTSKQCVLIGNEQYIKSMIESEPKSHKRCIGVEL